MQKGFTILELMIVILIIGVLAAIAIPSYQDYVVKTKRGEMKTSMMAIQQSLQRYLVANKHFADLKTSTSSADLRKLATTGVKYPQTGVALYDVKLEMNANNQDWVLTATPIAKTSQDKNGSLQLNSKGEKCWTKGQACKASASTKWDD